MLLGLIVTVAWLGSSVEGFFSGKGGYYGGPYSPSTPLFATGPGFLGGGFGVTGCPGNQPVLGLCYYGACPYGGTCYGGRCCSSQFATGGSGVQCNPYSTCYNQFQCYPGTTCRRLNIYQPGQCCTGGQFATQVCPNGQASLGPCGGAANQACPATHTCVMGSTGGNCCLNAATGGNTGTCPAMPHLCQMYSLSCNPYAVAGQYGSCPAGQACCRDTCFRFTCTSLPVAAALTMVG